LTQAGLVLFGLPKPIGDLRKPENLDAWLSFLRVLAFFFGAEMPTDACNIGKCPVEIGVNKTHEREYAYYVSVPWLMLPTSSPKHNPKLNMNFAKQISPRINSGQISPASLVAAPVTRLSMAWVQRHVSNGLFHPHGFQILEVEPGITGQLIMS
jgi:hypothetical protein